MKKKCYDVLNDFMIHTDKKYTFMKKDMNLNIGWLLGIKMSAQFDSF